MADAKICDRCGTTIVATSTAQKIGLAAWKYGVIDRNNRWKTKYDCDLCTECGEKLLKFLKGYGIVDVSDKKE